MWIAILIETANIHAVGTQLAVDNEHEVHIIVKRNIHPV